jgi:ATP-binding cassette subfamily F protein 3
VCGLAHLEQEHAAEQRCALEVVIDGDSQIGGLRQALAAAEQTGDHEALATLHQQFAEVDGYRAESRAGEILHGLGVTPAQQRQSVRALSGGLRVRVQLARALMTPSDLLLLDEPTNHLDLDAILWLESWLARYPGSLLVISHDRDFFDHVVNQILHLDSGVLTRYAGHYSDFERSRAEARRQQASAYQRQQQQLQQTQRFIDRFKAKASKAKQAQSRMKALEKLERIVALREESTLRFSLPSAERISNPLLVLDRISVARGERTLIEHFSATLLPDTPRRPARSQWRRQVDTAGRHRRPAAAGRWHAAGRRASEDRLLRPASARSARPDRFTPAASEAARSPRQ